MAYSEVQDNIETQSECQSGYLFQLCPQDKRPVTFIGIVDSPYEWLDL